MKNEKKVYEPAEIKFAILNTDMLITSAGTLEEDQWTEFNFNLL